MAKRGDAALVAALWQSAEKDSERMRGALNALRGCAAIFLSRPTDDVAFAQYVFNTAEGAVLGECDCDHLPDDGGIPGAFFNGPPAVDWRALCESLYEAAHSDDGPDAMEDALDAAATALHGPHFSRHVTTAATPHDLCVYCGDREVCCGESDKGALCVNHCNRDTRAALRLQEHVDERRRGPADRRQYQTPNGHPLRRVTKGDKGRRAGDRSWATLPVAKKVSK